LAILLGIVTSSDDAGLESTLKRLESELGNDFKRSDWEDLAVQATVYEEEDVDTKLRLIDFFRDELAKASSENYGSNADCFEELGPPDPEEAEKKLDSVIDALQKRHLIETRLQISEMLNDPNEELIGTSAEQELFSNTLDGAELEAKIVELVKEGDSQDVAIELDDNESEPDTEPAIPTLSEALSMAQSLERFTRAHFGGEDWADNSEAYFSRLRREVRHLLSSITTKQTRLDEFFHKSL
jgi:hypothetical protein